MTEEEQKMLKDVHGFLFNETPGVKNSMSRAAHLDEFLNAYRSGKFIARAVLWFSGLLAAAGAIWAFLRQNGGG